MADDLDGIGVFVAVAEAKGFRAAGERLGVSGSAVSQALRRLEDRVGVALVQRTTRRVRLTEAGERLYAAARSALDELHGAVAAVSELGDEPRGTLRLNMASGASQIVGGPLLGGFLDKHPHVQLELLVTEHAIDIVAEGYDAAMQLGERIDRDMIAVPVSGDIRMVVVAAPSYLARHRAPAHPRDLAEHECINFRFTADAPPYRWEFSEGRREFSVATQSRVLTNDPELNIRLARAGAGLTMTTEGRVRDAIARGELVEALKEFSAPFPGYYLYYPQRRHASRALRALIDYLKGTRPGK